MNVALIMERIEPWRGGAETSTMAFVRHLARKGCKVSMLTTSNSPSTPDLTIIPIKARKRLRAIRTWAFAKRAAEYVRAHDFDVVHSITPCPIADVYQPRGGTVPEMLERNLAIRTSSLPRGFKRWGQKINPKYRIIGRLERQLLARPSPPWVIAISDYVSDQLHRHYGFDSTRVRKIFNGVDPDQAAPNQREADRREIRGNLGLAGDELFVLCVAHNFKLKGVGKLIEAFARWRKHDQAAPGNGCVSEKTRVVIVGRDNPSPYVQLADRLGVGDKILFSGSTQRIEAFYHAADILAHPTFYDPCSRVVLEAMASGLPVITTKFNGAAERMTNGREGYVIESPLDVDALAKCIGRLADSDHRRACAENAPRAVEDISMAQHTEGVIALYEEIVRSGQVEAGGYR